MYVFLAFCHFYYYFFPESAGSRGAIYMPNPNSRFTTRIIQTSIEWITNAMGVLLIYMSMAPPFKRDQPQHRPLFRPALFTGFILARRASLSSITLDHDLSTTSLNNIFGWSPMVIPVHSRRSHTWIDLPVAIQQNSQDPGISSIKEVSNRSSSL